MRVIAVLTVVLLAGAAHAAGDGVPAGSPAAPGSEMFSPEWREQKIRDREANLQALDEEQRRFDKWERNARQAVGGICADCLGGGRGGQSVTIPGDAIPNVPAANERVAGFDESSAYYVVAPAPQAPVAPVPSPAPQAPRPAAPAGASAPLDIRTPAAR
ncbi:hypothetical protein ACUSIJ_17200 [Pseudochelatococcus sp. B33]